jgi:hypothetical protein
MKSTFDEFLKSLKEKIEQMRACFYSPQARVSFRNQIQEDINTLISKTEEQLEETITECALLEKQYECEDSLKFSEEIKQNPYALPQAMPLIKLVTICSESPYFKDYLKKLEKITNSLLKNT